MTLNSFFLRGSSGEQRLVQDLINEQLRTYGVEVLYLPRQIATKDNLFREVESSSFSDNFAIEAYVDTYEGYTGAGDIMTKFGMSLKDEVTLTISRERWEDFIGAFVATMDGIEVTSRPQEGDLIYFPLGRRIFEIKFVEHEKPFYQLGKNYVYQLQCELFELEDELEGVASDGGEIADTVVDYGYMTTLQCISIGATATVGMSTVAGYVRTITLNNDGSGYTVAPTVAISTSPTGAEADNAKAVAITTSAAGVYSVKSIFLTNPGAGYTAAPTVTIVSAATTQTSGITTTHGVGAAATATVVTNSAGIGNITITNIGDGYPYAPTITFGTPSSGIGTAIGEVGIAVTNIVNQILISDAGIGYTVGTAIATISAPPRITGFGTYLFNEVVTGTISSATGRVKIWNQDTGVLQLGTTDGTFYPGDILVGSDSHARYILDYIDSAEFADKYDQNEIIETAADAILDFSESNPFGQV